MSTGFHIQEDEETLTLKINAGETTKALITELVTFLFFLIIVLSFPYDQLIALNELLVVIYFLPLLTLPRLYKKIRNALGGVEYCLNKSTGKITRNNQQIAELSEVAGLLIKHSQDESYLELKLAVGQSIKLSELKSSKNQVNCGRNLAQFLNVELVEVYPLYKEVPWGEAKVAPQDIDHINSHIKQE